MFQIIVTPWIHVLSMCYFLKRFFQLKLAYYGRDRVVSCFRIAFFQIKQSNPLCAWTLNPRFRLGRIWLAAVGSLAVASGQPEKENYVPRSEKGRPPSVPQNSLAR